MEYATFKELAEQAEAIGLKLEWSAGIGTWEVYPGSRHQKAVQRIQGSIYANPDQAGCACSGLRDSYLRLPDGSIKRPDLAIFCVEPPETDEAVELLPAAVIEVVSKDFAQKDLADNPPLYLRNGVRDVVIFDPYTQQVYHHRQDGMTVHVTPVVIDLLGGCRVTV